MYQPITQCTCKIADILKKSKNKLAVDHAGKKVQRN
jgi:hypothetical protein